MFMDTSVEFEGSAQESALQRLWARRLTLTGVLVEEPSELTLLEDLFPSAQVGDCGPDKNFSPTNQQAPHHFDHLQDDNWKQKETVSAPVIPKDRYIKLDAALLGDIPACYIVPAVEEHEYPVVGVWMDPRVVPGFRYRVRQIQDEAQQSTRSHHMFKGRALTLQNIGRGYSRRVTFQPDCNALNDNGNYFWSDSNSHGYAFELEVVSVGDKFTLHDANHVSAGTLEVVRIQGRQQEVRQVVLPDGGIEKRVRVQALAKVEWYGEGQSAVVVPVNGLAVAVKPRAGQSTAAVTKVLNVSVGSHQRRGYTLTPGVQDKWRRTIVQGQAIGDVPTRYTIVGLEAHEMPVIGTYVDPRIVPGFHYKVRPSGGDRPLFGGRALRLTGVGAGYGKRLTFSPDAGRLNRPDNYLWSDTHPEGLAFEPRAVRAGMVFAVAAAGQRLGEASVFRADAAQQEERQQLIKIPTAGTTVIKHIHIDVTCHVTLVATNQTREPEAQVMRISGTAVVVRTAGTSSATLERIENIGLDSQLNLLFVTQQAELVFYPI